MKKGQKSKEQVNKNKEIEIINKIHDIMEEFLFESFNMKEIKQNLTKLNDYAIKLNKHSKREYKIFFKPHIISNVICKSFSDSDSGNQSFFPEQITKGLAVLSAFDCNQIIPIGLLMGIDNIWKIINTKMENSEIEKEEFRSLCHSAGSKSWKNISPNYIERYIQTFRLNDPKAFNSSQRKDLIKCVQGLIKQQEVVKAAKYIDAFNIGSEFNCTKLASQLINRDSVDLALRLVSQLDDKKALKDIINKLDFFKYNAQASAVIKSNGLDPNEFPKLLSHQVYGALRSFIKRHDWFKAEEIALQRYSFYKDKTAMTTFVKVLIKNKQFNQAYSVVQRHNEKIQKYVIDQLSKKAKPTQLLENKLASTDIWGPTEVGLKGEKLEEYLTLEDLGVYEEDVFFIDDDKSKEFKQAVDHLLSAKMVGADSEFRGRMTRFDSTGVATLQLSTEKMSVIFDCVALEESQSYKNFLLKFFSDKSIEKIGHSFSSDIHALNATFNIDLEFNNIVNVERFFMNGKQIKGLAKIVEEVYNKKFSKYNQESAWTTRPLRKGQLHYAALDAVSVLDILKKYRATDKKNIVSSQGENFGHNRDEHKMSKKNKEDFIQNPELLNTYIKTGQQKFLVDNMLQKLAYGLRNIGIDTTFVGDEVKSGKDKIKLAEEQERIILTKSKQIMLAKKVCPLIKITGGKSDEQLKQVIKMCKIKIDKSKILGRCVKCNNPQLVKITIEEAMESLKWENTDGQEDVAFFKCSKCLQIFWEGGMFDRAKKKFNALGEWSLDLPQSNKPIIEGKKKVKKSKVVKEGTNDQPQKIEKPETNSKQQLKIEKINQPTDSGKESNDDNRVNIGAINLTNIIEMMKTEILEEVNKNICELKEQLKKEIIEEIQKDFQLIPKISNQTVVEETKKQANATQEVSVDAVSAKLTPQQVEDFFLED